ncbi:hypothetical protein P43SY_007706 [Pythium insidiosum]|uniref:Ankyrin repeat protein n=1 Tax=Pythium insidiosum TaxID=114742 RepID=A0AAD5QCZ1_PYTIN|nr:hypothetical protein P43SY_007706 [Pythium insidiosum]
MNAGIMQPATPQVGCDGEQSDDVETERTWSRFQRFQRQRQRRLQREQQLNTHHSNRAFVLSGGDEPWLVFGKTRREESWRWIHDISGLHFSRLHQACADGDVRSVKQLLASAASTACVLDRDSSGRVPLHHAVIRERHHVVRYLMRQRDARLQIFSGDNACWTPIHYALDKMQRIALKAHPGSAPALVAARLRAHNERYRRLWRSTDLMLQSMSASALSDEWKSLRHLDEAVRGDAWDAVGAGDVERLRQVLKRYSRKQDDHRKLPFLEGLNRTLLHEACQSRQQSLPIVHCLLLEFPRQPSTKHCTDVYAKMTMLLLDKGVSPRRLSGDGADVTLLHRVACFSNGSLAIQLLARLLEGREAADVNVRDAWGWTPITYACASGRLETVCFLMTWPGCRLEAEFEGQTLFYYTLHLMPSLAWRQVAQRLLATRCRRAFLHCVEDGCACKSFEAQSDEPSAAACGFCSHPADLHARVPYPPWFRDQYETYRQQPSPHGEDPADATDEELLEDSCGRLARSDLRRIAALQHAAVLASYAVHIEQASGHVPEHPPRLETGFTYARVFQCFRRWKRWSQNAQVVVQELEALADDWHAQSRRRKLNELQQRLQALQAQIKLIGTA